MLHVCSYFGTSSVHQSLFEALADEGTNFQVVAYPCRRTENTVTVPNAYANRYSVEQRVKLGVHTRYMPPWKVLVVRAFVSSVIKRHWKGETKPEILHAHTLYTDGLGSFLSLKRIDPDHSTRFVVTVRGTDVNLGFRRFRMLKSLAYAALERADCIVVLSPAHKKAIITYFGETFRSRIQILPNGISDTFACDCLYTRTQETRKYFTGLYVGNGSRNKNVYNSIVGFMEGAARSGIPETNCRFIVVGCTSDKFLESYPKLPVKIQERVEFAGKIVNTTLLKARYDEADIFVMPSLSETFGLTYIEAISRCVPVVFLEGQGIDGYFPTGQVGAAAKSPDVKGIADAVAKVRSVHPRGLVFSDGENPAAAFDWRSVANRYIDKVIAPLD